MSQSVGFGMRGASADAATALTERLDDVDGQQAADLGEDLFAVARLLREEAGLRRALTDLSTPATAKADLAKGLFDGKVGDRSLEVLADAASRRWTAARDLADTLENLGVLAVVRSAGAEGERLSDELFEIGRLVAGNDDLRGALSDPARTPADKAGLLRGLLEGRTLAATVRLAEQSVSGSYRTPTSAIEAYQRIAAQAHDQGVATVRVARALTEDEQRRLGEALAGQYGHPVHLNVLVEPHLIGGVRVEIGDDVIDGTLAGRLEEARRRLAG